MPPQGASGPSARRIRQNHAGFADFCGKSCKLLCIHAHFTVFGLLCQRFCFSRSIFSYFARRPELKSFLRMAFRRKIFICGISPNGVFASFPFFSCRIMHIALFLRLRFPAFSAPPKVPAPGNAGFPKGKKKKPAEAGFLFFSACFSVPCRSRSRRAGSRGLPGSGTAAARPMYACAQRSASYAARTREAADGAAWTRTRG